MKVKKRGAKKPATKRETIGLAATATTGRRKRASPLLASIHDTVAGLHRAGVVKTETMRDFDRLCLEPVVKLQGRQIAALRKREKVSQPVFALYLNVSKSSVAQWESGEKNPDGAALKLLNLVKRKGLAVLA